jgi:raffinose/stachyose/melibiose transport system permease protein
VTNTRPFDRVLTYAVLLLFSALALLPFVGILLAALHPPGEPVTGYTIPQTIHFENFIHAWDTAHFGSFLTSSLIVSVSATVATVILSTLGGYAFGVLRFPGRDRIFYLMLIGLVLPGESTVVAQYFELRAVGLVDSHLGVILPMTGGLLAFGTFWMRAFFLSTPPWLAEAARLDGAGTWAILWRILFPVARPAVLTMTVLAFMWSWNSFLLPLVMLSSEDLRTAPLGLSFFKAQFTTDVPGLAAGSMLVALPVVLVYVFFQRQFIQGMLAGAAIE